ncbi:MAG: hypothetical protein M1820_007225 [Bogoriella megaspora]|nr:MAG: hypothetical protein M1820_007225 [Bogoriella megaspora]
MAPTNPGPLTWTIRFKYNKATVLLHIDPTQSFSSIKTELLRALQNTHPYGINDQPLPSRPEDIQFAKPNDAADPSSGWMSIEDDDFTATDGGDGLSDKKGKGKGKAKKSNAIDSMQAAGFKNGAVFAFKFREEGKGMDDDNDGLEVEEDTWDVVIPRYEDSYDEMQEGDVGVRPTPRG